MLSKNKIKFIKSLHLKKYRNQYKKFIVEGDKIVKECLNFPNLLSELYATKIWIQENVEKIPQNIEINTVLDKELKSISQLKTPNQALAILNLKTFDLSDLDTKQSKFLYLEGIRDPGNLGTILRTSEWFGFKQVLCSPDCVDLFNPKSLQATMGSFLRLQLIEVPLLNLKENLSEHRFYATSMDGGNIYEHKWTEKVVIIIGNEGKGISPQGFRLADENISIPKPTDTAIDSLNAAVSAALIMSIITRN